MELRLHRWFWQLWKLQVQSRAGLHCGHRRWLARTAPFVVVAAVKAIAAIAVVVTRRFSPIYTIVSVLLIDLSMRGRATRENSFPLILGAADLGRWRYG